MNTGACKLCSDALLLLLLFHDCHSKFNCLLIFTSNNEHTIRFNFISYVLHTDINSYLLINKSEHVVCYVLNKLFNVAVK